VLLRGTPVVKDNSLLGGGRPGGVCLAGT